MLLVLVVDDDAETRKLFCLWLKAAGHETREAANGVDAWVSVKHQRPDVIVLDYLMPIMDGRAFLRELRAAEAFQALPVVLVSGSFVGFGRGAVHDELKALAQVFLNKPLTRKALVEAVAGFTKS